MQVCARIYGESTSYNENYGGGALYRLEVRPRSPSKIDKRSSVTWNEHSLAHNEWNTERSEKKTVPMTKATTQR